ncbi:unnamed protein product [Amaranthus hypochondriacus]
MEKFIHQVLSWDIQSSSLRHRPHESVQIVGNLEDGSQNAEDSEVGEEIFNQISGTCDSSLLIILIWKAWTYPILSTVGAMLYKWLRQD